MIKVIILGYGNVGYHLTNALVNISEVSINQIFSRNKLEDKRLPYKVPFISNLSDLKEADVYIIALPDDAIASFSKSLPFKNKLVVHTSGSVSMEQLSNRNRRGVFYPLQTFSTNSKPNFKEIPICVEAEKASDLQLLLKLGRFISENVDEISSNERAKLHLAAVFVNNFVNHMYCISEELLIDEGLNFDLLKPLIRETAKKIDRLSPKESQTGPAKRNDQKTIKNHLHLLEDGPYKSIYEQLTKSIQKENN